MTGRPPFAGQDVAPIRPLKLPDAAAAVGVSIRTVYRWIASTRLTVLGHIDGTPMVDLDDVYDVHLAHARSNPAGRRRAG